MCSTRQRVDLGIRKPGKVAEIAKGLMDEGAFGKQARRGKNLLIRKLAMGACLLFVSAAFASEGHYTIRQGDTVSGIAHKLGVSEKQLLKANGLHEESHLKVGHKLIVPEASGSHHALKSNSYKVKEGDNDERIARHFHVTVSQLHKLNPEIRWTALRIGREITVPGSHSVESVSHSSKVAEHHKSSGSYVVRAGDNDIRIAKKMGISDKALRSANPGIDWEALQIGHKLHVPGGAVVAETVKTHQIHSHYASIASDDVNVRRAPRTDAGLVTTVDEGTRVTILDRDGSWYKVRFPKGSRGWVRSDFLVAVHPTVVASKRNHRSKGGHLSKYVASRLERSAREGDGALFNTAHHLLGTPYRYGGTSRSGGLDCSGFTSTVYRSVGVKLPRTSREQSGIGQKVKKSDLRPGDLVFFHTGRSSRINHVAIYEGNGKFIHASSGGGEVKESSLNEGYYANHFAGARRVMKVSSSKKKGSSSTHVHHERKHSTPDDGE